MSKSKSKNGAGKGDKPRNCSSKEFKKNYSQINWDKSKKDKSAQRDK